MTAFIGNAGNTGELKITPEAQVEFDRYGVDVFKFNKDNLVALMPHVEPTLTEEQVLHKTRRDKRVYWWYENLKCKQTYRLVDWKCCNHSGEPKAWKECGDR